MNEKLQTSEYRQLKSAQAKKLWESEEYREKISKTVSKGQKESWKNPERKQGKKVHFYELGKNIAKERGYEVLNSLEEYSKQGSKYRLRCQSGHLFELTYKELKNGYKKCDDCRIDKKLIELGYDRIWDCGNIVYEMDKEF